MAFASSALAWQIDRFDVAIDVQPDGSLLISETIDADFQGQEKHGIYRDIPLATQDPAGLRRSIRLAFLGAEDEQGRGWEARLTREGAYRRVRLGSENVTYRGRKRFVIRYRIDRALHRFAEHDELYWNATGNGWAVPIQSASATLRLPAPAPGLKAAAYIGRYGTDRGDARIERIGDNGLRYSVANPLSPFEGLTIVAGWPRGLVPMPSRGQRIAWFFEDNWHFGLPLLTLLGMWIVWHRWGRDPKPEPVMVRYGAPAGLSPAEAGALIDDRVDIVDITATIVDLARRGHLTIEQQGSQYEFQKKAAPPEASLKPHERLLLDGLFEEGTRVRLADLENEFYENIPGIEKAVYGELMKSRYWHQHPKKVRGFWSGVVIASVMGSFFLFSFLGNEEMVLPLLCVAVSAGIVALFARYMPRKTGEGSRRLGEVLGLQEFMRRTDQDRLRRESDPKALYEELLPYAMALGVTTRWSRAFDGIYQGQPDWYRAGDGDAFRPSDFGRRINTASRSIGSTLTSTPRSSGGSGFSGGSSGGGGGGGSW